MTSLFTDYGYWDELRTTNKLDKFNVEPDQVALAVYQIKTNLESARIHADRALDHINDARRLKAEQERFDELRSIGNDVQLALAAAIEALTGEKVETPSRERTIKTLPIDRVGKEVA